MHYSCSISTDSFVLNVEQAVVFNLMTNFLANMRNRSKVVLAAHQVPEQTIERVLVALRVLTALYEIEKQPSHIAVEELLRLAENDEERTMALDDLACLVIKRELPSLDGSRGTPTPGSTE
jgi:hypothetical protein